MQSFISPFIPSTSLHDTLARPDCLVSLLHFSSLAWGPPACLSNIYLALAILRRAYTPFHSYYQHPKWSEAQALIAVQPTPESPQTTQARRLMQPRPMRISYPSLSLNSTLGVFHIPGPSQARLLHSRRLLVLLKTHFGDSLFVPRRDQTRHSASMSGKNYFNTILRILVIIEELTKSLACSSETENVADQPRTSAPTSN